MTESQSARRARAQGASSPVIRFGTHRVSPPFDGLELVEALNTDAQARLVLDAGRLAGGPIEYRCESGVEEIDPRSGLARSLFAGWVSRVELVGSSARVQMRSGPQLDEARLDRFSHAAGISSAEVIWSLARFAGYGPDQLNIAGLRPIVEDFSVVLPVRGLAIEGDVVLERVRLTPDRAQIETALSPLPDKEGREAFLSAGVWAVVRTSAGMLLDAERQGMTAIEGELDRLALGAQYSLGAAPDGSVHPFDRASLFADPEIVPIVLVRGTSTPRAWLRSLRLLPFRPAVGARRVALKTPPVGHFQGFDDALRAWRRAVRATEPLDAVTAIWEAIEFYAAATRVPAMFSDTDIASAVHALEDVQLTESQRDRLRDVIGSANNAPLFVRLRAALDHDRVPFSEEELSALKRTRTYRNNIIHGRAQAEPVPNDVEIARAFVNRMLAFRGAALGT